MPKIKHIAIATQDVDKTARFYIDVFGLKEIGKVDSPNASGYYLSDGDLNMAILNFKKDEAAGASAARSTAASTTSASRSRAWRRSPRGWRRSAPSRCTRSTTRSASGRAAARASNVEVKYSGPDGVMVDVSETGSGRHVAAAEREARLSLTECPGGSTRWAVGRAGQARTRCADPGNLAYTHV